MKKTFTILTIVVLSTTISFAQQGTVALGVGSNLANTDILKDNNSWRLTFIGKFKFYFQLIQNEQSCFSICYQM